MRMITQVQALSALAALALLAACSGGGSSAIAPSITTQSTSTQSTGRFAGLPGLLGQSEAGGPTIKHRSFYNCPATGRLTYISIWVANVVEIYAGQLNNQSTCGEIALGLSGPYGLYVDAKTHDLFVANSKRSNIKVFHRGHLRAYNTYVDPTDEFTLDVAVAPDGTVIASNENVFDGSGAGSLSTWIGGANGGTFVGNFPMTNSMNGQFVAIKKNGTVYFSDVDQQSFKGLLWTVACPAGACGTQTQVAGVSFESPGGMVFDDTGDLLVIDDSAITANTFELPNPSPSTCALTSAPVSVAFDRNAHTFVTTDDERFGILEGLEYSYPGCVLVGRVGSTNSQGIAIDL